MPTQKPFKRTVRQLIDNSFSHNGNGQYVEHIQFSDSPDHYLRAFNILLKDFISLLDYIEPSDVNLNTYSYRIHELLLRTCIEVEANFVAILSENGYQKSGNWNMNDYKKVNSTHHLSTYEVKIPNWKGVHNKRNPFECWQQNSSLEWFKAYNKTKHDRHTEFEKANFQNLTDAICGLAALLASQFMDHSFSATDTLLSLGGPSDGYDVSVGEYFRVKFPRDWTDNEKYGFNWADLRNLSNPIEIHNYQ